MFYDSNGEYYDITNDENDDPRNPKFFDNHIHLVESKLENGYNAISFILKLKNTHIKINPQCFLDAEHLNKYCKKKGIVGYDKLRMMIFLLKDFTNIYYTPHQTDKQYDILLDITDPKLTYEINGFTRPILTRREIGTCIETLETYAIICTAISKIDEFNTGGTGETILYEAMNPTQFNQYLRQIDPTKLSSNDQIERYRFRQGQIQDKKEDFLKKTNELIVNSKKLIIKMSQLIFDLKTYSEVEFTKAFSDDIKMLKSYESLNRLLEENALKIREVNEDNSHQVTLKDMDLDKDEMLTKNGQGKPYLLPYRYNWDEDEKGLMEETIFENRWFHWPKWYDWLVKRERVIFTEYNKRVGTRAIQLEEIKPHIEHMKKIEEREEQSERARARARARAIEGQRERQAKALEISLAKQAKNGGPIRNIQFQASDRFEPYKKKNIMS
jgi:hypothetical protein